jgi:YbbR domain-containing protein
LLKKLRSIFMDNLIIKLFSLLFAVVLWMYASTRGQSEINFVVPLELRDMPVGMMLAGNAPHPVDVRLMGDEMTISSLSSNDVGAFISLAGASPGETLYSLTSANIKAPPSVTINRVSPAEVRLRLDKVLQKQLPVRVRVKGRPARGYRVADVHSVPENVFATGPQAEVDRLDEVVTEPFDITGLTDGTEKQLRLVLERGSNISLDVGSVKAVVVVEKRK